jgi:hypothetical protein
VHRKQRERALKALAGQLHRPRQAAVRDVPAKLVPENIAQQRRGDLGVGLRREDNTLGQKLLLQLRKVFNDAVVDHRKLPAIRQMRVRVLIRRATMRGPPRVANAGQRLRQRPRLQLRNQVAQLPGLLPRGNLPVSHNSHTRRVIPPVLQTAQPLKNNIQRTMPGISPARRTANITHDSTHG